MKKLISILIFMMCVISLSAQNKLQYPLYLGKTGLTTGKLYYYGITSGLLEVRVAAAAGTGTVFQYPANNGTNGYVLTTNGSGVTSWAAAAASGVTSVATGLGLSGGTITTTGTLLVDTASASILSRQRAVKEYKAKNAVETVTKGGTGVATTTAYGLLAGGTTATGAFQNIGAGTAGQIPVSAGAAALPAWTSPVDATTLNLSTYSYVIDTIAGVVSATARAGSGLSSYTGTVAATVINQAIAALTSGGDIYFKRKNYTITTSIVDGSNSDIKLIFERGAKLTAHDALHAPVIYITGESHWRIENATIDGNANQQATPLLSGGTYPDGIWFSTCSDAIIKDCYIYNCRRFGANFDESSLASGIINSVVTTCGWNCINLGNHNTDLDLFAINNDISHASDVGIALYGTGCRVQNNAIHDIDGTTGYTGAGNYAITVEGGGSNLIEDNRIYNCDAAVYIINAFDRNKITGNSFYNWDAKQTAVCALWIYSDYNMITDNIFYNSRAASYGIKLEGSNYNFIGKNSFTGSTRAITIFSTSTYNSIIGNFFKCTSAPLYIDNANCSNNAFINNDLSQSVGVADDSGTGTIYSNNILGSGVLQPSPTVSITELGYLDGVTSAIQTQLTSKVAKLVTDTLRVTDATYTLALTDAGKTIRAYRTTWQRITVPLNSTAAFPIGTVITVKQDGAGIVKFLPASGVIFKAPLDSITMNTRYSWVQLIKQATDKWEFVGRLED
jgi:parallel beta-helix repeat protein